MVPTIGRDVILHGHYANGTGDHPAKITRVWTGDFDTTRGPACVNLTVFGDGELPHFRTSVMLFETREQALAHCAGSTGVLAAHWPVRVDQPA